MVEDQEKDIERLRKMADDLGCILEEDFRMLAQATQSTVEAWRKRGQGPAYIRIGNRVLYSREAVSEHLQTLERGRDRRSPGFL